MTVVVSLLAMVPSGAALAAEDPKVIAKVTDLNKKALEAYAVADLNKARQFLKQALELCETSGLEKHAITARTYIHIGVVLVGGMKQKDLAVKQFRKALEIQPDIQVTRNVATPDVLAAFKEAADASEAGTPAEGGGDAGGEPAGGGDEGDDAKGNTPAARPAQATGVIHTPVTKAKAGAPILITVKLGANLSAAKKVVLSFRNQGDEEFTSKDMARAGGGRFAAQIPAGVVKGKGVAYFVEAQDDEGTVLGAVGGESKPFSVALGGGKKCPEGEEDCDEDEGSGGGGPSLFFSLGGGSGLGYATGYGDRTKTLKVTPGFAASSVAQLVPEIGYFLAPDMRLSLQARVQFVAGPNDLSVDGKSVPAHTLAVAALVRSSWFFGTEGLRPYVSAALGGGQISHVVLFQKAKSCGKDGSTSCIDSVTAGPIFVGGGAGLAYDFTENLGMLVEVNSLLGFTKFTFHLDLNAGISLRI